MGKAPHSWNTAILYSNTCNPPWEGWLTLLLLEVPAGLKYNCSNFPPIFNNFNVSRADIGGYVRDYAAKNNILKQHQRMLISSFNLENGTINIPLLIF